MPDADAEGIHGHVLPVVSPTPQWMSRIGTDATIPQRIIVMAGADTDSAALATLQRVLRSVGPQRMDIVPATSARAQEEKHESLIILLGSANRPDIAAALGETRTPASTEGYALRVTPRVVALGGVDATGQFYAVKTLSQLARDGRIAGVEVSDHPSMPLRGTVEGFYGPPWTTAERLDHLGFLGDTKANTYIYAPKNDPYHREQWREPYPADMLADLEQLVDRAAANHVRFVYALSPGLSICYSDPADIRALTDKFQALYDIGVRSFSIPLDDIDYTRWNCEGDRAVYGEPGPGPAAAAQVKLLNHVQREFIASHDEARSLHMVPTEYDNLAESAYRQTLREGLDPAIEVMWTGSMEVIAAEITVDQAIQAEKLFGRKVFIWDNYPVNDYWETIGRLLLAPYDRREPGLSNHVSGLVSNPINEAAASKLAMFTMNDFAWNDSGYDRAVSGRQAALYVAGGNAHVADAVQVLVDLNHAAPMWSGDRWQPQAPAFSAELEHFWQTWEFNWCAAARQLRPVLRRIEKAPTTIRAAVVDELLLSDMALWLDSTELWGKALHHGLNTLMAIKAGGENTAARERVLMGELVERIGKITTSPDESPWPGPVMIGDPCTYDFVSAVGTAYDAYQSEVCRAATPDARPLHDQ
mgnify:CR=1 FL=1